MPDLKYEKPMLRVTISQIIAVTVKNLIMVAFGMIVGYPTILIPGLSACETDDDLCFDQEQISWIGSIQFLSIPIGCTVSGLVSQAIGRKKTMQASSIFVILTCVILKYSNEVWQIYTGVVVFGLIGGLLESPVLTYVAEICEPRLRGSLLATGSLSATLGTLLEFFLGSILHWRDVALYSVIVPSIAFICLFFIPESPYWLITKNKHAEAQRALAWARGWTTVEEVDSEFQEFLLTTKLNTSKESQFKIEHYIKAQFVRPFILVCYLHILYNFSGIQTILVHAINIFETLEVPLNEYDATVYLGLAQFLGCSLCVISVSYTGRRPLALASITLGMLCMTAVGTYSYLNNMDRLYATNETSQNRDFDHNWIPLTSILLFALAITCGLRPLVWSLVAESFPLETRAVGTGSLGALAYIVAFAANKTFLELIGAIKLSGVFWFYASLCAVSVIIVYFWLPETEGRSLQEITEHFAGRNKLNKRHKKVNEINER